MKKRFCKLINAMVFCLFFIIFLSCGGGGGDGGGGGSTTPPDDNSSDAMYQTMLLLRGNWTFEFTILSKFTYDYTLSTIVKDTNSQGGYYIYGEDEFGDDIIATYWPDDDNWSLLDTGSILIDRYYVFYTDGSTILDNSCYYQITKSTKNWSRCYTLSGRKTSSTPSSVTVKEGNELNSEEELLREGVVCEPIDDYTNDKFLQMKEALSIRNKSKE